MIERIDFLLPPAHCSEYEVLPYFTHSLMKAVERTGVRCRLLGNEAGTGSNLTSQLLLDPPDCTLSFNGLLPDHDGKFFCDSIQIPHVACLVDSPNKFLSLVQSELTLITCVDRAWANFFRGLNHGNAFFMAHAVDREFAQKQEEQEKVYDVSFLGTCLDIEQCRNQWQENYPEGLCAVLDAAVEMALADQDTSYMEAFTFAMDQRLKSHGDIDPSQFNYSNLFDDLEIYIRGKDRIDLLRNLKDVHLHVFGTTSGSKGWNEYLAGTDAKVTVHGKISYTEALEVMRRSRVVLSSCPSITQGAHERVFAGAVARAVVMTNENPYVSETFTHGENILFYRHGAYEEANQTLSVLLQDKARCRQIAERGRELVLVKHTWDQRAHVLLDELAQVLRSL